MEQKEQNRFIEQIQNLLFTLIKNFELCEKMCLSQHNVTVAQAYTLLAFPKESSISMNELSEAKKLANSTMTRITDNLVKKDFVFRQKDQDDRRVVRVGLTDKGKELQTIIKKEQEGLLIHLMENIGQQEQKNLVAILDKVISSIDSALCNFQQE